MYLRQIIFCSCIGLVVKLSHSWPIPQSLTEEQFRGFGNEQQNQDVKIVSGYSRVARFGRGFANNRLKDYGPIRVSSPFEFEPNAVIQRVAVFDDDKSPVFDLQEMLRKQEEQRKQEELRKRIEEANKMEEEKIKMEAEMAKQDIEEVVEKAEEALEKTAETFDETLNKILDDASEGEAKIIEDIKNLEKQILEVTEANVEDRETTTSSSINFDETTLTDNEISEEIEDEELAEDISHGGFNRRPQEEEIEYDGEDEEGEIKEVEEHEKEPELEEEAERPIAHEELGDDEHDHDVESAAPEGVKDEDDVKDHPPMEIDLGSVEIV